MIKTEKTGLGHKRGDKKITVNQGGKQTRKDTTWPDVVSEEERGEWR